MKKMCLWVMAVSLLGSPCLAAGVDFVFDFQPGSILISPDADGFEVSRDTGWVSESEEIEGVGSWLPTLRAGLGIDTSAANLDLTGGVGLLLNGAFTAPVLRADAALRFKLGRLVTLGPHLGLIRISSPNWLGEADLEFSDSTGLMGGLDFSVGKVISFLLSVDYVKAEFDVEARDGWVIGDDGGTGKTSDTLDLSGVAVQAGIMGRF